MRILLLIWRNAAPIGENMKAIVDQDTCISCGLCVSVCPEVYSFNEDEKSVAIDGDIPKECEESAKEGRDSCPVDAIDIKE